MDTGNSKTHFSASAEKDHPAKILMNKKLYSIPFSFCDKCSLLAAALLYISFP
jgi:hypothetical protein